MHWPDALVGPAAAGSGTVMVAANLLVAFAGVWFGVVVFGIARSNDSRFETGIWRDLVVASLALVLYGLYNVVAVIGPRYRALTHAFGNVVFMLFLLFLAFGIRRLFHESSVRVPYLRVLSRRTIRRIELLLVANVVVEGIGLVLLGNTALVHVLFGTGGTLTALYGTAIGVGERSTAIRGTTISSVIGYLVPALGCAGLVPVLTLARFGTLPATLVTDLQHVVIVVVAAFLMMATVRLHDLLGSLR